MEVWHIWVVIGIIFLTIEVITFTLISASIAISCFVAAFFSFFNYSFNIQLLFFTIGTLLSFFVARPFVYKKISKTNTGVKTNIDALIGKAGRVVYTIDNSRNEGYVQVEGCEWKAETEGNIIINEGEKVKVLKVNSTILLVKPLK